MHTNNIYLFKNMTFLLTPSSVVKWLSKKLHSSSKKSAICVSQTTICEVEKGFFFNPNALV